MVQDLGKRFRELRIKNDMSQDYVASALGVSMQAVSKWENGKSYPDISNLVPLSDLLHVSVDDLLDKDKNREKWEDASFAALANEDGNARIQVLKEALIEFPGDHRFRYQLASEEFFLAGRETDPNKRMRLLALADDHLESLRKEYPEFSNAVDMHVRVLAALGRKDEALDLAKLSANHERLLLFVLEGEELKRQKRKLVTLSVLNLFADLMREGSKEALNKAEALITTVAAEKTQFAGLLLDVYYQQALLCCEEKDFDGAVEALKAAKQVVKSDPNAEAADDNGSEPFFQPLILPKTQDELQKQFEGYLRDERFSCLRSMGVE